MKHYKRQLRELQIELVKFQRHLIEHGHRVLIVFEGRDTSGKDGVIKRFTAHLSPRETRVVALGKPSDRDQRSWYFQRYVPHLPADEEMVLFNRSWYSRAGVERVMGFCSEQDVETFFDDVLPFEELLIRSGVQLFKYYLDISRQEQAKRLQDRRLDPLKQWKTSPVDAVALERWDEYSAARNEMLMRSHSDRVPWYVVRTDDKESARLNVIRHFLSRIDCPGRLEHLAQPDGDVVFQFALGMTDRLAP